MFVPITIRLSNVWFLKVFLLANRWVKNKRSWWYVTWCSAITWGLSTCPTWWCCKYSCTNCHDSSTTTTLTSTYIWTNMKLLRRSSLLPGSSPSSPLSFHWASLPRSLVSSQVLLTYNLSSRYIICILLFSQIFG